MQNARLLEVKADIERGIRHIARHREIITELASDGHDITPARRLLETLETRQRLNEIIQNDLMSA